MIRLNKSLIAADIPAELQIIALILQAFRFQE